MRSIHWLEVSLIAGLVLSSGCGGGGSASVKVPAGLTYATATAVYTKGMPVTDNGPTSTGGAVTSYRVVPALPAGLAIGASTGIIGGTPTAVTSVALYTVTASNAAGGATIDLSITVVDAALAQLLPNLGSRITPLGPEGARFEPLVPKLPVASNPDQAWQVGQAVTTIVSPDKKTLLVLTSGYNRYYSSNSPVPFAGASYEYVFIYDISTPRPIKKQVVTIPNSYSGIAFDPSGTAFYVPGNIDDSADGTVADAVNIFVLDAASGTWMAQPGLPLGHTQGLGLDVAAAPAGPINSQVFVKPCPAGVAISSDGQTLVVANYYNDSISVFRGGLGSWSAAEELDLRPGKHRLTPRPGVPGGEYPFWVAVAGVGPSAVAFVSSIRDREIDVVALGVPAVVADRVHVKGQPGKMALNAAQSLLYVVEDQTDSVDVIDTATHAIVETISTIAPASALPAALQPYTGANSNSVTLSPDERELYVTNGNLNAVAVVALGGASSGDRVVGLIPTGWYPNSVSFSGDGRSVYVVNGKSPTGPNPGLCYSAGTTRTTPTRPNCFGANQYNPQRIKAGFQSFPRPSAAQLATLTAQVAANNRFSSTESAGDAAVMAAVHQGVKHVIFVIKENRTYDQILGDLEVGNGDPDLTEFGEANTPNLHNLARGFVTLDNFMASAEVSNDGWPWTTSARAPEVIERQFTVTYAGRALSLDSEGVNRNVNVAIATAAERRAADPLTPADVDLLAGQTNVAAPDGPGNEINTGYLWDAAMRAGLTVRNYGFFLDTTLYASPNPLVAPGIPETITAFADGTRVAIPASVSLAPVTDPYFRGFDNAFPDYYRYAEWARDFDVSYAAGGLPALSLVRFMHDHTGNFDTAIAGLTTPELQQADNDYAVGLLVQKIAESRYASDTLIFVIEDDSQDGGDHVDSHRSVAFVAGAYVKQGALVSTLYNTIDFVRTIEEVLGLPPMNLNDAVARPMADVFNTTPSPWSFTATPSAFLYAPTVTLPLPPRSAGLAVPRSRHGAKYWARVSKGMDFASEDRFDFAAYNRTLWTGIMGRRPYPGAPTGLDLRRNRAELLAPRGRPPSRKSRGRDGV